MASSSPIFSKLYFVPNSTASLTVTMPNFHFPEDLLPDVLSRLPVKTLVRFRLVSKSWRDLIESRSLSKMYLNRLDNSSSNSKIIIREHCDKTSKLYAMDFSTNAIKELHCPRLKYNKQSGVELLGSSNGVLCLLYAYRKIVLWNPLSLKYWELYRPKFSSPPLLRYRDCAYGFGYDNTNDDYKVVALVGYFDYCYEPVSYGGWTYSLKLKRWKRIENFSYPIRFRNSLCRFSENGILVSGALHWITQDGSLLAFDLADEKFRVVPQPNYRISNVSDLNLGVFGDCLSFTYRSGIRSKMWVMKNYGVKDSWTMINLEVSCCFTSFRPIGYVKSNSQVILQDDTINIFLYDLEKQSLQKVAKHLYLQAYPYLETLECYDGMTDESARKSSRHKRTRRAENNDASTSMDRNSAHHSKRKTL